MLKHTSNAGGPTSGQLRTSNTSSTRNIQLRPPQPLNIATLNSVTLQNCSGTATSNINGNNTANGGSRIATLLNISPNTQTNNSAGTLLTQTATTASSTAPNVIIGNCLPPPLPPLLGNVGNCGNNTRTTSTTPVTPIITHLTTNGLNNSIGNNLYTNQHIALAHAAAAAAAANNGVNANSTMLSKSLHNNNNNNNNNNATVGNANTNHQHHHSFGGNSHNYTNYTNAGTVLINQSKHGPGPREALTSLGLLCLVSLLLALLSLIFLLKISPNAREDALSRSSAEDFIIVYDVTLALCALSLSLNLCCLLVCAIQFLFAVKLVRSPMFDGRDNRYLEKSSISRTCAVGGFFISIPVFLTGIILYTFNHFHSTPAIITSILIGIGIVFCGAAMVHNVFIWQKEKTISYRNPPVHHPPNQQQQSKPHLQHTAPSQHMSLLSQIGPITPPLTFLNQSQAPGQGSGPMAPLPLIAPHLNFNHSVNTPILLQPTPVTPVSPNHSHGSSNPLANLSSSFQIRPATATPPTPKPLTNGYLNATATAAGMTNCNVNGNGNGNGNCSSNVDNTNGGCGGTNGGIIGREASGSISPGLPTMEINNVTSNSSHELSTLV